MTTAAGMTRRVLQTVSDDAAVSDQALLARHLGGDEAAFAALVRRHGRMVFGVCRRALTTRQDAEDAAQAVFVVLARTAGAALDELTGRETLALLDAELDRLPPRYREPLVLCYLEGLSRDEAAARLGVPGATLKSQLERGRKRLADALAARGVTLGVGLPAVAAAPAAGATPTHLARAVLAAVAGPPAPAVLALIGGSTVNTGLTKLLLGGAATVGLLVVALSAGRPRTTAADPPAVKARPADAAKPVAAPAAAKAVGGTVVGPDGKPVEGAGVFVQHDPFATARPGDPSATHTKVAVTAADGTFRAELPKGLPPHFGVYVTKPGFGVAWEQSPHPNATLAPPDKLALRLAKDHPVAGRVVDTEGKPVAGLSVRVKSLIEPKGGDLDRLLKASAGGGFGQPGQWEKVFQPPAEAFEATTDRDGKFEAGGLGADRVVVLLVSGKGFARQAAVVVNRPGVDVSSLNPAEPSPFMRLNGVPQPAFYTPSPTVVVQPGFAVEGVVTEAGTGKPVPGCVVDYSLGWVRAAAARTDADGKYRLEGLTAHGRHLQKGQTRPTRHALIVTPPADRSLLGTFGEVSEPADLDPAKAATVDLRLATAAAFTGRVVDKQTREPVAAVFQIAPTADNAFAKRPEYETAARDRVWRGGNPDGTFRLHSVPGPLAVRVRAVPSGLLHGRPFQPYPPGQTLTVDLKPDGNAEVTVELDRGKTADVTVVDGGGKPLTGLVTAGQFDTDHGFESAELMAVRLPAAESKLTVYGLSEKHPRQLVVLHPEKKLAGAITVDGRKAETMTLHPLQPLRGRFTDPDGTPLAGVRVTVVYDGLGLLAFFRDSVPGWATTATTDKDGRFDLPDAVPGLPFTLDLRKAGVSYLGKTRIGRQVVSPGEPLDLGTRVLDIDSE